MKSVLSGNLKLASFYPEGLISLRVTKDKTFDGEVVRAHALLQVSPASASGHQRHIAARRRSVHSHGLLVTKAM